MAEKSDALINRLVAKRERFNDVIRDHYRIWKAADDLLEEGSDDPLQDLADAGTLKIGGLYQNLLTDEIQFFPQILTYGDWVNPQYRIGAEWHQYNGDAEEQGYWEHLAEADISELDYLYSQNSDEISVLLTIKATHDYAVKIQEDFVYQQDKQESMGKWLMANTKQNFELFEEYAFFVDANDAILFKLTFGGE